MSELITDEEATALAWNILARSVKDPNAFQTGLRAFAQKNPTGVQKIYEALKAAGLEATSTDSTSRAPCAKDFCAPKIGSLYNGKGVYVGEWQITDRVIAPLYVAPDLERDYNCIQIQMTFNQQKEEFAKRNSGRTYGNGCTKAITQAIVDRTYNEGDCFHGPLEFLNGKDINGNTVRDNSVFSLLKAGNLAFSRNLLEEIKKGICCWAFSGTEEPNDPAYVRDVRLGDDNGDDYCSHKDQASSGMLPFRAFGIKRLAL